MHQNLGNDVMISSYSALGIPALQKMLNSIDRIIITGVIAQCCVLSTLMGLIDTGIMTTAEYRQTLSSPVFPIDP